MQKLTQPFEVTYRPYAEINYDRNSDCDYRGCDTICRCSRIENAKIISVSFHITTVTCTQKIPTKSGAMRSKDYKFSEVESYCIDRLLRLHKAYDPLLYEVVIENGYYGEELGTPKFVNKSVLISDILEVIQLASDIEKVKFVLNKEYSFLLETVDTTSSVSIVNIELSKLAKNVDYASRIKKQSEEYNFGETRHRPLPIGVVVKTITTLSLIDGSHGYRLIDGYHRLASKKTQWAHYICLE